MINLASLSALIRTLRHTTGVEGPAAPVARVATVQPVARDDAGAMTSTALRPSPQARTTVPAELLDRETDSAPSNARAQAGTRDSAVERSHAANAGVRASDPRAAPVSMSRPDSTALELTAAARLLQSALRGTALQRPEPPTIVAAAPLVLHARPSASDLARGLARAVAESGLFYESHLARVLRRDYPMAAVAREPQASWPASPIPDTATSPAAVSTLSEPASSLLTRQLDVLDTRAVVWAGAIWPGRHATVAFEEQPSPSDGADAPGEAGAPPSWRTRVTIELPSLGRVEATLQWHGDALDIALAAVSAHAEQRLAAARAAFESQLSRAAITLRRFDIAVDDETRR